MKTAFLPQRQRTAGKRRCAQAAPRSARKHRHQTHANGQQKDQRTRGQRVFTRPGPCAAANRRINTHQTINEDLFRLYQHQFTARTDNHAVHCGRQNQDPDTRSDHETRHGVQLTQSAQATAPLRAAHRQDQKCGQQRGKKYDDTSPETIPQRMPDLFPAIRTLPIRAARTTPARHALARFMNAFQRRLLVHSLQTSPPSHRRDAPDRLCVIRQRRLRGF